jgi:iron complex outermembrane receptor protein
VEAGAGWSPVEGLLTRVAYTYTDARFDEYAVEGTEYDGNRIPGVAPHRVEAGVSYEAPRGFFAALDARYASEVPVNDENEDFSPAYTVVDLRAGVEGLRAGGVRVAPFVGIRNLFDEHYNTSVTVNAWGGRYYEPGPGRTLYVGARVGLGME